MALSFTVVYRRPTGTTGAMVSGCRESAHEYALDRATDYGLAATVETHEACDACRGAGRVPGRRRLSWLTCKACKGEPTRLLSTETVEPAKRECAHGHFPWTDGGHCPSCSFEADRAARAARAA